MMAVPIGERCCHALLALERVRCIGDRVAFAHVLSAGSTEEQVEGATQKTREPQRSGAVPRHPPRNQEQLNDKVLLMWFLKALLYL